MKQIPAAIVHEDDNVLAFKDIYPQKPIHIILIPKTHIVNLNDLNKENAIVIGQIALVAKELAEKFGVALNGYRLTSNCGSDSGQSVYHLHFHLLGGAPMIAQMA